MGIKLVTEPTRVLIAGSCQLAAGASAVGGLWATKNIALQALQQTSSALSAIDQVANYKSQLNKVFTTGFNSLKNYVIQPASETSRTQLEVINYIKSATKELFVVLRLPKGFTYSKAFTQIGICFVVGSFLDSIAITVGYESTLAAIFKRVTNLFGLDFNTNSTVRMADKARAVASTVTFGGAAVPASRE